MKSAIDETTKGQVDMKEINQKLKDLHLLKGQKHLILQEMKEMIEHTCLKYDKLMDATENELELLISQREQDNHKQHSEQYLFCRTCFMEYSSGLLMKCDGCQAVMCVDCTNGCQGRKCDRMYCNKCKDVKFKTMKCGETLCFGHDSNGCLYHHPKLCTCTKIEDYW